MESLAERITRAFPEIGQVEPLREVGLGARSRVVETAEGIAVKMGRVPAAAGAYENEWQALPVLASRLSVPIPAPRWRALPGDAFQHGALTYAMLRGLAPPETGSEALARDLGRLLAELHALPPSATSVNPSLTRRSRRTGRREAATTIRSLTESVATGSRESSVASPSASSSRTKQKYATRFARCARSTSAPDSPAPAIDGRRPFWHS